ncbi:MAG: ribosome maturation factor RimM, partial [Clostridia bacterium]|nr:ribosome maturation factor RimM [Clostridia bacterium]
MSLFKLGQITSPVGIKGEVRVYPYFSDITRFSDIKTVLLDEKECQVLSYRIDKNMLVVKLDGITDRNAAETLRNKFLYVPKENFKNPEGTYFVEDLIGVKVYDENDPLIYYNSYSNDNDYRYNNIYIKKEKLKLIYILLFFYITIFWQNIISRGFIFLYEN